MTRGMQGIHNGIDVDVAVTPPHRALGYKYPGRQRRQRRK